MSYHGTLSRFCNGCESRISRQKGTMAAFYFAKGIVRYKNDWIIIEAPHSVVNYYKWWVEKLSWKKISTSYHGSHITVLAGKHEKARDKRRWGEWDGREVTFKYFSTIYGDAHGYYWLRINCPEIPIIRKSLGLEPLPKWPPHLTIGYCGY